MASKANKCCCCPPCSTQTVTTTPGCCRCIPKYLCVGLSITDYTDCCTDQTMIMEVNPDDTYTGSFNCSGYEIDLEISLYNDGYGACFWRLYSYGGGFDELIEVGYNGCENLEFTLPVTLFFGGGQCEAIISVATDNLQDVPEEIRDYDLRRLCNCRCVCEELCYTISGFPYLRTTGIAVWDGSTWSDDQVEVRLVKSDYSDECLVIVTIDGVEFEPTGLGGCGRDVSFFVVDYSTTPQRGGSFRCVNCNCDNRVVVRCCDLTPVPVVLYATIAQIGGDSPPYPFRVPDCGCIEGTYALSLVFNDPDAIITAVWRSGVMGWPCCASGDPPRPLTWRIWLRCGGTTAGGWNLFIEIDPDLSNDSLTIPNGDPIFNGDVINLVSCDPFLIYFQNLVQDFCECGMAGGRPLIEVAITE